ncbi:uncharacterized protein RHIMIDRAFT_259777 [Rhizopus microsporus ATCC 52813]|uniref:Uncharacterized protein n=1 Tax=Rhizopus microsporus ATCC 52813 TaxID=1340429 RepID=A0A2G4SPS7_RHIZD|nr:uncharacterized protein RHIMIDRAFT_259777 [Rhizopus microsporus ATCC 52813]PHZ10742.1 hypothetical protein RHIMIDRAFT_259777 [Rhizopus microsporus ATCC 52813]
MRCLFISNLIYSCYAYECYICCGVDKEIIIIDLHDLYVLKAFYKHIDASKSKTRKSFDGFDEEDTQCLTEDALKA